MRSRRNLGKIRQSPGRGFTKMRGKMIRKGTPTKTRRGSVVKTNRLESVPREPNIKIKRLDLVATFSSAFNKLLSTIRSLLRENQASKVARVLRWFEKGGDEPIGELQLDQVELAKLQKLFDVSQDDPMYDSYLIETSNQIRYIQKITSFVLDTQSYDYFLECEAV